MNFKNSIRIAERICRQIRHDKRTMLILFITPIVVILIFGYSFRGQVTDVRVMVVNRDGGFGVENLADKIMRNLDTETLTLEYSKDDAEARESVENANVWAIIIFPSNFTRSILTSRAKNALVSLVLDGSNPVVAAAVVNTVNTSLMKTSEETGVKAPFGVSKSYVYGGENTKYIDFFAPGIICTITMMLSLILVIVSFVRERTTGTLNRLFASPITEGEIVVGYALAFSFITLVQAFILLVVAVLIFGVSVQGNIFLAFGIIVLFALGCQGLGMTLSAVARNEFQAVQFVPLLITPSMLLAGVFWPLEAIPSVIRRISYVIPLTYAADALRSVTVRGWGPGDILVNLVVLSLLAIITMCSSFLIMAKKR